MFDPPAAEPPRPEQICFDNRLADISQIKAQFREIGQIIENIVRADIYEHALIVLRNAPSEAERIAPNAAIDWDAATMKHTEIAEFSGCYYIVALWSLTRMEKIGGHATSQLHSFEQMPIQEHSLAVAETLHHSCRDCPTD